MIKQQLTWHYKTVHN